MEMNSTDQELMRSEVPVSSIQETGSSGTRDRSISATVMGKFLKDSYASTYAVRNVKEALDKLIDVLQSPAQVRKLVNAELAHGSRKPVIKLSAVESPANTPLWMETSAALAKKPLSARNANQKDTIDAQIERNPTDRKQTPTTPTTPTTSSSASRASETQSDCCESNSDHIPVGRFTQLWKRSLRDYPVAGIVLRSDSREYQRSRPLQLEAGWSSVPCKSGHFDY